MTSPGERQDWPFMQRVAFRFIFIYFVLFLFPGPVRVAWVSGTYDRIWNTLVPWTGTYVLHLAQPATAHPTGSGDTLFNWVQVFCFACLALAGTALWSWLDRRRLHYRALEEGFRIFLRYTLGFAMLRYGFAKVFPSQFQPMDVATLMEPYGRSSPMHLMWTFMAASSPYTVFAGAGEVLGAILLLIRRTATAGALVVSMVMANVVMLNFCYDVPVKRDSLHILAVALLIAMPDLRRLFDFLVLRRPVDPPEPHPLFKRAWLERGALISGGLFAVFLVCSEASQGYQRWRTWGSAAPLGRLEGLYRVEGFVADGKEMPPLMTDASRWSKVAIYRQDRVMVQFMDESRARFSMEEDEAKQLFTFTPMPLHPAPPDPQTVPISVRYSIPDAEHLILDGTFDHRLLKVRLKREDLRSYLLVNRGFHWVSEYPYNR